MHPFSQELIHLNWSDFWQLCKRFKTRIAATVLIAATACAFFSLIQPVEYQAEGTFREKNNKSASLNSSIMDMFVTGGLANSADNEALTILKSKKILHHVIKELGLQGAIVPLQERDTYRNRIKDNSVTAYAHLLKKNFPIVADSISELTLSSIIYNQEVPLQFLLHFSSSREGYTLFNNEGKEIGNGKFNQPFVTPLFQFTINGPAAVFEKEELYSLTIYPLNLITAAIQNKLQVENDVKDKNLIKISFRNRNRYLTKQFVNTLMKNYHNYLHDDHRRQAGLQLDYLKEKQNEAEKNLNDLMLTHAFSLSKELNTRGFADSGKEMEFLAKSQHEFKERLISNELEIKRLKNVQMGKCVYYDQLTKSQGDHNIINSVLEEIRDCKQQRDSLALALEKSPFSDFAQLEKFFVIQQAELEEVKTQINELNEIIAACSSKKNVPVTSKLYHDPRYIIKTWNTRIQKERGINLEEEYGQFLHYLNHLKRLFMVRENVIQKRLTHQQMPSTEFQGVNLKTAQDLYLEYSKKLNELEAKKRENGFLIHQMEDANFEITSLSTVLTDAVSHDRIQKASRLLLDLKDQNNRTEKEQSQLKEELFLERSFLLLHLQQTNHLLTLNQELVKEKISSLQSIILELIHQHISVLEKNLHDYISTRLENLKQERIIIEQHMHKLHQEMATLPERWIAEKMIEQNLEMNELIVQEVAKMVESKNISHRLELIQSAPVDFATLPLHPLSPHLLLFSFVGMIIGGLLSTGWILKKALGGNLPASSRQLTQFRQQVVGNFSRSYLNGQKIENNADDLETLRRLKSYLDEPLETDCQPWLLLQGSGPEYSADLAKLLIKNGKKTLRIFLNFEDSLPSKGGLLQFLENQIDAPLILADEAGSYIETGGESKFYNELLGTKKFQLLLKNLSENYDAILAVSSSLPTSANAEHLALFFSKIAITIRNETVQQLKFYIQEMSQTDKKIGYIVASLSNQG